MTTKKRDLVVVVVIIILLLYVLHRYAIPTASSKIVSFVNINERNV